MRKIGILGFIIALVLATIPTVARAGPAFATATFHVIASVVLFQIIPGDGALIQLLNAALDLGISVAGTYLFTELGKAIAKVDKADVFAKRIIVFVAGTVVAGINHALGLHLPEAWGVLSQADVAMFLTTGLTYLAHAVLNKKGK